MLKLVGTLRNGSRYSSVSSNWCLSNYQSIGALSTAPTPQKVLQKKEKENIKTTLVDRVFKSLNENELSESEVEKISNSKINEKKIDKIKKKDVKNVDSNNKNSITRIDDLNESYANVESISISESIKLMTSLASRQRRVTPLLNTLANNINNNKSALGIKNIADILYSMSKLNFRHELLLNKLSDEIKKNIKKVSVSPIIGSILTSIGMLRYRNDELMDELCIWCIKHKKVIRTQDMCALVLTSATIGYVPANSEEFFSDMLNNLQETDMIKTTEWLDVVWSLTVLNRVTTKQIESVLNENFHIRLADPISIPLAKKHKLLNINAYAKLIHKNYNGPFIDSNSSVFEAPLVRAKHKQMFVKSITDALANLFPSRDHFRCNVDEKTGFLTDVEFYLDQKGTPMLIDNIKDNKTLMRIAILANHYHDYCLGSSNLLGSVTLHQQLLKADGYKIINISHSEMPIDDTLLMRITFINNLLKAIIK